MADVKVRIPLDPAELAEWIDHVGLQEAAVQLAAERKASLEAVSYVLIRAQQDERGLGYHLGPGMQAFTLLCLAEATATGRQLKTVEQERGKATSRRDPSRG